MAETECKRIGDIALDARLITKAQLDEALAVKKSTGARLGEVLVSLGYLSEVQLARALADQLNIPYIEPGSFVPDARALKLIDEKTARRYRTVPVSLEGNTLTVVMADPLDLVTVDDLARLTNCRVERAVATDQAIERLLTSAYGVQLTEMAATNDPLARASETIDLQEGLEGAPIVKAVNSIIRRAVAETASDIHLEPGEDGLRVRFRIDGLLREVYSLPKQSHAPIVSRLKIMGGMDISERRLPQDGRVQIAERGREIDLRLSSLPTIYGEKLAIRILDQGRAITDLGEVGFDPETLAVYRRIIGRPHGMVLVTGPTGSGKTTTLTATLHELNHPSVNIVTLEDPVEYQAAGVNQVQISEKTGLTFASGLRTIVRQDPDIIMVGEIRDGETAEAAVRSSLTGHLVFSTLHTNGATATVARLLDMGIERYLLASSLSGVVAQRLVRKLCRCRHSVRRRPSIVEREILGLPDEEMTINEPVGCAECGYTGYRGRVPVFEVLEVTPTMRELIYTASNPNTLEEAAVRQGMVPLLRSALAKALAGETSLSEVQRVAVAEER